MFLKPGAESFTGCKIMTPPAPRSGTRAFLKFQLPLETVHGPQYDPCKDRRFAMTLTLLFSHEFYVGVRNQRPR